MATRLLRRLSLAIGMTALVGAILVPSASARWGFESSTATGSTTVTGAAIGTSRLTFGGEGSSATCEGGGGFQSSTLEGSQFPAVPASSVEDWECYYGGVTSLKMNGCTLTFHAGSNPSEGSVDVGPSGCGSIALIYQGNKCVSIGPQSLPASYTEEESESGQNIVTVELNAQESMRYTIDSWCGSGSFTNGSWQATWQLTGTQGPEEATNLSLTDNLPGVWRSEATSTTFSAAATADQVFDFGVYSVDCSQIEAVNSGVEGYEFSSFTVNPAYSGPEGHCTLEDGEGHSYKAFVQPEGCGFEYGSGTSIRCEGAGEGIKIKVTSLKLNCVSIPPQELGSGTTLTSEGSSFERTIGISSNLSSMEYVRSGACGSGSYGDGEYAGAYTLSGSDATGEPVGIWYEE